MTSAYIKLMRISLIADKNNIIITVKLKEHTLN